MHVKHPVMILQQNRSWKINLLGLCFSTFMRPRPLRRFFKKYNSNLKLPGAKIEARIKFLSQDPQTLSDTVGNSVALATGVCAAVLHCTLPSSS